MAYIFAADSIGLSSFNFFGGLERVCDFLLLINGNFGPILHCFCDMASYWLKLLIFLTALWYNALARGEPFQISG